MKVYDESSTQRYVSYIVHANAELVDMYSTLYSVEVLGDRKKNFQKNSYSSYNTT